MTDPVQFFIDLAQDVRRLNNPSVELTNKDALVASVAGRVFGVALATIAATVAIGLPELLLLSVMLIAAHDFIVVAENIRPLASNASNREAVQWAWGRSMASLRAGILNQNAALQNTWVLRHFEDKN